MLTLAGYGYSLIYRPSKEIYCADMLSRLPLLVTIPEPPQSGDIIHLMANVIHDEVPVTVSRLLVRPISIQICHKLNAVLCQVIGHH